MLQDQLYEFGPYRIDVALSRLERDGCAIPLPPKAFDLLLLLARNHYRVMGKSELMEALWPETFVEDANVTQHVLPAIGNALINYAMISKRLALRCAIQLKAPN